MTAYYKISRKDAAQAGLKRYFTGVTCCKGHVAERFVSTRTCCACNDQRNATEELRKFRQAYYANQYSESKDEILARGKQYNATPNGRVSTIVRNSRRRAAKQGAEGSHTKAELAEIRLAQNDQCAYCHKNLNGKGSLDHVVALSRGGSNWRSNLQWLCRSCNSRKHTKDAIEFAQQLGMLL